MVDMLGLVVAFTVGVIACAGIVHRISVRWRLPWSATLAYFGVLEPADKGTPDARTPAI
jgi:hypothetical protein